MYVVLYAIFRQYQEPSQFSITNNKNDRRHNQGCNGVKIVYTNKNVYTSFIWNLYADITTDYIHDTVSFAKMWRTNCLKFEVSLHWPFVRVSLTGVCRSAGSCLVYCNVHVQMMCWSFTHLKRCWRDFPTPHPPPFFLSRKKGITFGLLHTLYNSYTVFELKCFIVCCNPLSKVLFAFIRSVIPMQITQNNP